MAPLASPMGLSSLNYIKCSTNPQLDFLLSIKCDVAWRPPPPNEHHSQLRGASRPAIETFFPPNSSFEVIFNTQERYLALLGSLFFFFFGCGLCLIEVSTRHVGWWTCVRIRTFLVEISTGHKPCIFFFFLITKHQFSSKAKG